MTADEVLEEFLLDPCCIDCPASDCINERRMAEEIVRLREENDRLHQQYLTGCLEDRAIIQRLRDANDRLREELAKPLIHEDIMKRVADDVGRVIANALNNLPTEPPHDLHDREASA